MAQAKKFTVVVGEKVAYSVQFLRNTGMSHSSAARGRGVVTGFQPLGSDTLLAVIDWGKQHGELPEMVNVQNLAKVGLNTRFSNC